PCNPTTVKKHNGWRSPAEKINQFRYHDCWLQNMLISASLGGFMEKEEVSIVSLLNLEDN
ncbi:MAG: hypothetical protein U9N77_00390, partial [Thermodesulfobacteriota bacterium]|nr:hypothetical protein [Thermodesulfobacteriota bacterium]